MLETWLVIAFIAPMLWSLVNLIDVYFVDGVYQDEYDGTIISGLFPLLSWVLVPFGLVTFHFPKEEWGMFLLGGGLFLFANFFYFRSLFSKNDAALIQIFWNLTVPFTIVLSWIFIGERLFLRQYIGIVVVLGGVVYLSLQDKTGAWNVWGVLKGIVPASFLLAASLVISESAYRGSAVSFFDGYLLFALGMAIGAVLVGFFDQAGFRKRFDRITTLTGKYFVAFFCAELLALVGTITSQLAVDLSPSASFVATVESLSPVFVMIFSFGIVFFGKHFIRKFSAGTSLYALQFGAVWQKVLATVTVAIGIFLVS